MMIKQYESKLHIVVHQITGVDCVAFTSHIFQATEYESRQNPGKAGIKKIKLQPTSLSSHVP